MDNKNSHIPSSEPRPPLFKSWKTWYLVVVVNLAALIVLFYIITKVFGK